MRMAYLPLWRCCLRSITKTFVLAAITNVPCNHLNFLFTMIKYIELHCMQLLNSILRVLVSKGRRDYELLYPQALAYDLMQDPYHRPKRSDAILSTLTTGCSKVWLANERRYITGLELIALHSIPATSQLARLMQCKQVCADAVSNTMQAFFGWK